MTDKRDIIVVFGATGQQGGSVVDFLVQENKWKIRAVTRMSEKTAEKVKQLKSKGVEVIKADQSNLEELKVALKDVYGVFLVTQPNWEISDKEKEVKEGKNVIDVCKLYNIKHLVFSGLDPIKKLNLGYEVHHFETKAEISEYSKKQQIPMTEVRLPAYMNNFDSFWKPKKDDNGNYSFTLPLPEPHKLDLFDVNQFGGIVVEFFKNPKEWIGKTLGIASCSLSVKEMAEIFTKVMGKKVIGVGLKPSDTVKFMGSDLSNMFQYYIDFEGKIRDIKKSFEIYPKLHSFEDFLRHSDKWKQI